MRCAVLLDCRHLRIQRKTICCLHIGRDPHITHGTPHVPIVAKSWHFHNPVGDGMPAEHMRAQCGRRARMAARSFHGAPQLGGGNCCGLPAISRWICGSRSGHDDKVPHSVSFDRVLSELQALRAATRRLTRYIDRPRTSPAAPLAPASRELDDSRSADLAASAAPRARRSSSGGC